MIEDEPVFARMPKSTQRWVMRPLTEAEEAAEAELGPWNPPASVTPGPGEDDLRDEDDTGPCNCCGAAECRCGLDGSVLRRIMADRDAAVEQRTLAEQKVARVEALLDSNPPPDSHLAYQHVNHAVDDRDPDCGACWVHDLRAALADPEADRGGTMRKVCGQGVGGGEVCWLPPGHDGDHDPDAP